MTTITDIFSWATPNDWTGTNLRAWWIIINDNFDALNTGKLEVDTYNSQKVTQDNAIALNTAKTGITPTQASNITANNAKISFDSTSSTRLADTSWPNTGDNATNSQYSGLASSKQDTLVSWTNIKTINGNNVLWAWNLVIAVTGWDMTRAVYDPTNIDASAFDRANHTGTQTASTISDFDAEVANNSAFWDKADITGQVFTGAISATNLSWTNNWDQTKASLWLDNVDNTSDSAKNSAVATLTNKDLTSATNTFPFGTTAWTILEGNKDALYPKLASANTFTSTGNTSFAWDVWIGTTSPIQKLQVAGNILWGLPLAEWTMVNGKIFTSVASNNLTVSSKTKAGTDASTSNPIYVVIDWVVRTITGALSVTKNAGTNWSNSWSAELATREIDFFTYLWYNATDWVTIWFSRIPNARVYSDFSATTTNEKYASISVITNAVAWDKYVNIGRFNATLSASPFNWSIPATSEIIDYPIYETRLLDYVPQLTWFTVTAWQLSRYRISWSKLELCMNNQIWGTSNSPNFTFSLPFWYNWAINPRDWLRPVFVKDNGVNSSTLGHIYSNTSWTTSILLVWRQFYNVTWTSSWAKEFFSNEFSYNI